MIGCKTFAALMASVLLSSCGYRNEEFRYRMTVEVETPQGLRTGSSVIEVEVTDPGDGPWVLPEASGGTSDLRGEAVTVDLPDGKTMFALLRSLNDADAAVEFAYLALHPAHYRGEYGLIERTKELKRLRGIGVLPRSAYPMLVAFGDPNDPSTVMPVDPDDLEAKFGKGVRLRRITVQMTEDPVTMTLPDKIPWFELYADRHFDGSSTVSEDLTADWPARLSSASFSSEIGQ